MPGKTVKTKWSAEEDRALQHAVARFPVAAKGVACVDWKVVSDATGRTTKQCRERYSNVLDPTILRTPWTREELLRLFDAQKELGNKWSLIAARLPGRPETAVKNTYYAAIRREKRRMYAQANGLPLPPPFHPCMAEIDNLAARAASTTAAATNTGHDVAVLKQAAAAVATSAPTVSRKRRTPTPTSVAPATEAAGRPPRAPNAVRARGNTPSSADGERRVPGVPVAAAMASFTMYDAAAPSAAPPATRRHAALRTKVARIQAELYGKLACGVNPLAPPTDDRVDGAAVLGVADAALDDDLLLADDPALWFADDASTADSASTADDMLSGASSCRSWSDAEVDAVDLSDLATPVASSPAPARTATPTPVAAMPRPGSVEAMAAAAAALATAEAHLANALATPGGSPATATGSALPASDCGSRGGSGVASPAPHLPGLVSFVTHLHPSLPGLDPSLDHALGQLLPASSTVAAAPPLVVEPDFDWFTNTANDAVTAAC